MAPLAPQVRAQPVKLVRYRPDHCPLSSRFAVRKARPSLYRNFRPATAPLPRYHWPAPPTKMSRNSRIYAVATMDTKGQELAYVADRVRATGAAVVTVDVGAPNLKCLRRSRSTFCKTK